MSRDHPIFTMTKFLRPRRTIVLGTLVVALLVGAVLVDYGDPGEGTLDQLEDSKSSQEEARASLDTAPLEPTEIRWLSPQPQERLTGSVELRWEILRHDITSLDVWIDERHLLQVAPSDAQRIINTEYLSNGLHRLELRAVNESGRSLRAAVDVQVHNSDFSIPRVSRPKGSLKNGEELVLEMTTRGSGFEPQADFTAADSAFDAQRVTWNQLSPNLYQLRYRLSTDNKRPDGSYRVKLSLVDQVEPSSRKHTMTRIDLQNTPLFSVTEPPIAISCGGIFRPDPLLPSDATNQTLERIAGPARVAVGEPVNLRLFWAAPTPDDQRFLKVSIDGVEGYFTLHGACSQEDEISLTVRRPSGPEGYRIAIWPRNGVPVVHRLIASP